MKCCNENCEEGRKCPNIKPADNQLVWIVLAFIALMLALLTLRSCL